MTMATINAEAVRSTIGHVLGILGDLQARLDNDEETELSQRVNSVLVGPLALPAKTNDTVDARWYAEKCKELDDMEHKYTSKCKAYDQLLIRFQQVQGKQPEQTPLLTSLTARQNVSKMYTFDDFDELEKKMCVPGSGTRGKRTNCDVLVSPARDAPGVVQHRAGAALDNVTPTKRARKEPTNVRKPNLLSSPPPPPLTFRGTKTHRLNHANKRTFHDPAEQRLRNEAAAGVKCSSQETRMDSSELGMPSENIIELCPATDDEHSDCDKSNGRDQWREILDQMDVPRNQTKRSPPIDSATKPSSQRSVDLQRILDAIGDCQPCRTFYSMPGLALPKRDPLTLCMHKKKGQSVCSAPELVQTPVRNVAPAARSERRPSTPEHFWDIDYFPAIRTAGPEVLRKSRR
ncbi:hypothetical protein GGH19_004922 [Coemansia sp. RSA 1807]|nr:hypothetical protein EV176_000547 [Coemansia sp. RSA 451]KAJ2571363.1 hypothetical protein GGH19_004922 [Coemansia sp. RSA 1807]